MNIRSEKAWGDSRGGRVDREESSGMKRSFSFVEAFEFRVGESDFASGMFDVSGN